MVEDEETFLFGETDEDAREETGATARAGRRRQWVVLGVGVLAFAAFVFVALRLVGSPFGGSEGEATPWRAPAVDGASVTVTWDSAPCATSGEHTAEEEDGRVVLTIRETPRPALCSSPQEVKQHTFQLDEPVGDRELVDGATGRIPSP